MSVRSGNIFCDGCDYKTIEPHIPIILVYHLDSGETIKSGRTFGWCHDCDMYVDIEDDDKKQLQVDIYKNRERVEGLENELKRLSKGILGFMKNKEEKQEVKSDLIGAQYTLERCERQFKIANGRKAKPRCLKCWGENTERIKFDNDGCSDFTHSCGGKLHLAYEEDGMRFHCKATEIHLDQEGNVLREF